jgi:hypothetical protein
MTKNTYTKLNNGEWGIRADGKIEGTPVLTVTKKDGSIKKEIVGKVLWTGKDKYTGETVSLCSIAKDQMGRTTSRRQYTPAVCPECEFNQDAGDMQGCPKHRGNPHC